MYSGVNPQNAIWSPCNRVIAIIDYSSVVIVDAVTLSQLDTFAIPFQYITRDFQPSFSPDGHRLTLIGGRELLSWDLQTGGPLGAIPSGLGGDADAFSSAYSEDGKVVAAAYSDLTDNTFIHTYDVSGTETGPRCTPKGRIIAPIWTHEKCIRFVAISPGSVAVLEVEFTLKNPPVEVESLPISDKIVGGDRFLFLPSLSRLAFTLKDTTQVWDAKAAKLLLKSESPPFPDSAYLPIGSFSSDGRFFAHVDKSGAARVWKESPAGYVLHQKLQFDTSIPSIEPRLSPSGESIFMSPNRGGFHLWHTRDQVSSPLSVSAGDFHNDRFTLVFSPNERFAAFARRSGHGVTIFDPLTSDLQSTVNTDMGIVCLGMTGSALIVVGKEKIVTLDLPGGDYAFDASIKFQTTILHLDRGTFVHMSISPDFSRIAVLRWYNYRTHLQIYDMSTGRCLTSAEVIYHTTWVGFTWDGHEVWTAPADGIDKTGWKIVEDSGSGPIRLEPRDEIVPPSGVFPWESRCGYEVTGDGWVLSATQKRLLWLPRHWRSKVWKMAWSGRFLGLLHHELWEIVILEFPE